jgi:hypothetical protein
MDKPENPLRKFSVTPSQFAFRVGLELSIKARKGLSLREILKTKEISPDEFIDYWMSDKDFISGLQGE